LFPGETLERFTDRGAADTELCLKGLLTEHVAGRQIESDNPAAKALVGLCTQWDIRDTLMIYQVRSSRTHRVRHETPDTDSTTTGGFPWVTPFPATPSA
jgi:hypothetical protein